MLHIVYANILIYMLRERKSLLYLKYFKRVFNKNAHTINKCAIFHFSLNVSAYFKVVGKSFRNLIIIHSVAIFMFSGFYMLSSSESGTMLLRCNIYTLARQYLCFGMVISMLWDVSYYALVLADIYA